jgi:hypothetical protein
LATDEGNTVTRWEWEAAARGTMVTIHARHLLADLPGIWPSCSYSLRGAEREAMEAVVVRPDADAMLTSAKRWSTTAREAVASGGSSAEEQSCLAFRRGVAAAAAAGPAGCPSPLRRRPWARRTRQATRSACCGHRERKRSSTGEQPTVKERERERKRVRIFWTSLLGGPTCQSC